MTRLISKVAPFRIFVRLFTVSLLALGLTACNKQEPKPAPLKRVKVFQVGDALSLPLGAAISTDVRAPFRDSSALSFDAAGRVMAVLVKEGDVVAPGQPLVRLDPSDLALSETSARAQLMAAQAELAAAEADFRRYADLHAKGFISDAEHQRRQSQLELTRARFEAVADQLGFITLRAIERGTVKSVLAREGLLVEPRQLMVSLAIAYSGGGSAQDRGANGRPPQRTEANVIGLRIPLSAVVDGGYVYRIQQDAGGVGVLEKVAVSLGAIDESSAAVISGLARGDRIVAAGTHVLSPQERVRLP